MIDDHYSKVKQSSCSFPFVCVEKDESEVKEKEVKENLNKADQQILQAQTDAQRALIAQQQQHGLALAAAQQHAAQQAAAQHQALSLAAAAQIAQAQGISQQQGYLTTYLLLKDLICCKIGIFLSSCSTHIV